MNLLDVAKLRKEHAKLARARKRNEEDEERLIALAKLLDQIWDGATALISEDDLRRSPSKRRKALAGSVAHTGLSMYRLDESGGRLETRLQGGRIQRRDLLVSRLVEESLNKRTT